MKATTDHAIRLTIADRRNLDRQLDEAVTVLMAQAVHRTHGILVTRHDYASFTVSLSDVVPYGLTRERYDW